MVKLHNYTAHDIVVYSRTDVTYVSNIRKYVVNDDVTPVIRIPSEGMKSVTYKNRNVGDINGIPLVKRMVVDIDPVPVSVTEEKFIVSVAYATAARNENMDTDCLLTILDSVYNLDGSRIVGCLGFCKV